MNDPTVVTGSVTSAPIPDGKDAEITRLKDLLARCHDCLLYRKRFGPFLLNEEVEILAILNEDEIARREAAKENDNG